MDTEDALPIFSALSHPTRLAVFRLLIEAGPDGLPALEIGRRLRVLPSTLSGHLGLLKRSDILTATRHQREIHYAANLKAMNDLIGFLLSDCCKGSQTDCATSLPALAWVGMDKS